MLFDLRSPGRRFAIKTIYLALAILLGGGLVLFGVGSGVQGGLFDAFKSDSQQLSDDTFVKRAEAQERAARANPSDPAAWSRLAALRFQAADYDDQAQSFTSGGREQLGLAARAWDRHLSLAGNKPDANTAKLMVQVYDGLERPAGAVRAQEIVLEDVGDEATSAQYVQLAFYAYQAKQTRKAELAGQRAVQLAPRDERAAVRDQIESLKQAAVQADVEESGAASGG